ncbi:enoyl-CoA hydratase/isomerase family protein [Roseateles violae]|uniref:Enoyl-CoA hydratase/isomerase family protein n=1 Tax=Roseateles violae TaxID=3058042 RepID=A0ABT8DSK6_9BURK|nr:enoyl-CoA hydratase/isomerase family protein [Pelomonas sp. PFR6]MDN3921310.1 enoyl-CoA hydratase/isomerase family protein [Pelomonas sp. PFR6]
MTSETVALRDAQLTISEDGIALFMHQRPAARNALSMALRQDYQDMLARVQADRRVRVLVISGSGGSFCAGGDLKALKERHESADPEVRSPDAMRRRMREAHVWVEQLRSLELPVIAAVDGPAYGAGFSIALAADFVLASTRASFCMSFAKVGLVPDFGALYMLPRAVGLTMAKELAFSARRVGVEEAQRLGIVHAVHEPEALDEAAQRFAQRFLGAPREALALSKSLLNKSFETNYATLAELECQAQGIAAAAPYHAEAVGAFLRGEPARFDWDRDAKQTP